MFKNMMVLFLFSLLLVSCLGIEQVVTINPDNSGTISFTYKIAKEISDLGSYGSVKKQLPLPVLRSDFERTIQGKSGLALAGYSSTENEKDVIIHADVSFTSLSALSGLSMPDDAIIKGEINAGSGSLSVEIPSIKEPNMTDDDLEMLKDMSDEYDLVFTVHTPKDISGNTGGEVAKDKRSASFRTSIYDLAKAKEKQHFTINW